MCFDIDSAPPILEISGAAVSHDDLVLEAADGNLFAAFVATPEEPSRVGVVILPDVRGLYRFYEELALRFAERGYAAIAFDYFGRTAGVAKRGDDFEYMPHVERTTQEGIQADVAAAVAQLRGAGCEAVFTVGFCFGGRNSWLAAAAGHGLAGPSASTDDQDPAATAHGGRRSVRETSLRRSSRCRAATTPGSRWRSRTRSTPLSLPPASSMKS